MNEKKKARITSIIDSNKEIVNFGGNDDAVSSDWIEMAEARIGLVFSPSYRWFLDNYVGGEVGGEEIFGVYGVDFDAANGGDIVYRHLMEMRNGVGIRDRLTVSTTDLGEIFFFDYSVCDVDEIPIKVRLPSGDIRDYAEDFYDFLEKRILAYSQES